MPPTLQQPRHGLLTQPFPPKGRDGCAPMGMKNISFRERFDRQGVRSLANPRSLPQEERKCTWRVLLLAPSPPLSRLDTPDFFLHLGRANIIPG